MDGFPVDDRFASWGDGLGLCYGGERPCLGGPADCRTAPGFRRYASSDAVKPWRNRTAASNGARLARQYKKDGLRGVLRVVQIPKQLAADVQDHRTMSLDQGSERRFGCLVMLQDVAGEQIRIVDIAYRPQAPKWREISAGRT